MNIQKIETVFTPGTMDMGSGCSISRIEVWSRSHIQTIQFWIFDPNGKKLVIFEGLENIEIALAALRGFDEYYKNLKQ